ncbi:MAG: DUF559 domain-containing protein [Chloroflexi bacterium]|nr:DUF559 domain-containing protein [Chloroflexota bacterium]
MEQTQYDQERTAHLEALGYKVVRFWNNDVMKNIGGVVFAMLHAIGSESCRN